MVRKVRWAAILLGGVSLLGCTDALGPSAPPASPRNSEYDNVPPEYQQGPSLGPVRTEVGFMTGRAYGMAIMDYYGNRAEQTITLTLRRNNAVVMSTTGSSEQQSFFPSIPPGSRRMVADAGMGVSGACGHMIDGASRHTAWQEFWTPGGSLLTWAREGATSIATASQEGAGPATNRLPRTGMSSPSFDESVPGCQEGVPGSGGGSGSYHCTTTYVDHYWYYPETGQVEYRYTTSSTNCEMV